jgi:hypothetical protein
MRATHRRPHVPAMMDLMRPSQLFGAPRTSSVHDPRRWMRRVVLTLAGAAALLPLLGAATRALAE